MKNKPELKIVVSNRPEAPAVEPAPEQVEMPFAIVNGEPVTQMPKDLYIPPQAMEVFLEAFEGPLDLLLYLIRRQNLNILDIPLAEITRQYMQYIEVMSELQLELAGEYMVMAATLAEIKSRMLLPRPKMDPEGTEEDPRAELVRRLQEYERFKRAAESIDALPRLERDVWATSAELKDRKVVRLLPTVTLQEMLIAFKDVVVRSEMFAHHHIQRERLSVRERMGDILTTLEHASFVEFVRLFRLEEGRMGVTVTFMALLELVREGLIEIVQAEPFAPIHVRAAGASRKLHVVGGNDAGGEGLLAADEASTGAAAFAAGEATAGANALAAGGAPAGATALAAGGTPAGATALAAGAAPASASDAHSAAAALGASAAEGVSAGGSAVAFEAGLGDTPPVGIVVPTIDEDLARFAEPALDPNFVDDSDDDVDEGPLEGVDDVVDLVAPVAPEAPETVDVPDALDIPEAVDVPGSLDVPESLYAAEALDAAVAQLEAPEALDAPSAPEALGGLEAGEPPNRLVESERDLIATRLPDAHSAAGAAGASVADPVAVGQAAELGQAANAAAVAPVGEAADAVAPPSAIVEAFAAVEPLLVPDEDTHAVQTAALDAPAAIVESTPVGLAEPFDAPAFAPAGLAGPGANEGVVIVDAPAAAPLDVEARADVASPVHVAASPLEPSATNQLPVSVDPTTIAAPAATVESQASDDGRLDEPPPLDVEYALPTEEVASGEQATSDDEVSLVGNTPVAGEVSLIGDESVSGGPTVEIEEIAFNELPALDETRPEGQPPAANAQTVLNENAGTDEPPSLGEESDD